MRHVVLQPVRLLVRLYAPGPRALERLRAQQRRRGARERRRCAAERGRAARLGLPARRRGRRGRM